MEKQYEQMELRSFWGLPLEKVVTKLLEYHKQNRLVSAYFNGVTLYSDTVTMDDAYLKITGKTKAEFDAYEKELKKYSDQKSK